MINTSVLLLLLSLTVAWGVIFVVTILVHHRERRDLYSRLMAGSLAEYKAAEDGRAAPRGRSPLRQVAETRETE